MLFLLQASVLIPLLEWIKNSASRRCCVFLMSLQTSCVFVSYNNRDFTQKINRLIIINVNEFVILWSFGQKQRWRRHFGLWLTLTTFLTILWKVQSKQISQWTDVKKTICTFIQSEKDRQLLSDTKSFKMSSGSTNNMKILLWHENLMTSQRDIWLTSVLIY